LRSVDLPDNGRTIESAPSPTATASSFTFFCSAADVGDRDRVSDVLRVKI